MYDVISTGIIATVLYLISWLFYRAGLYNRNIHRRIWNFILAAAFIFAAFAGLFLALQINYKWNIPYIKAILRWHVECGIALSFTGLFHFLWHLPYFYRKEAGDEQPDRITAVQKRTSFQNGLNLFIVGFASTGVQLLLMREIMNIAGGYELVTGIFLASWLIGSAAGSSVAKRSVMNDTRKLNIIFVIAPLTSLMLMILLSRLFLNPGETPSFLASIIFTLAALLPFTFVTGFTFIRLLLIARESENFPGGRSFSVETAGGVVAGIAVSILGAGIISTYRIFFIIILILLVYIHYSYFLNDIRRRLISGIPVLILAALFIAINPDKFFRQLLLRGVVVEKTSDTQYGNITIGKYGGEQTLYYNHHPVKWENDEADREENIHYAMLQHDAPENVLLISGDINAYLPEVLKYPVKRVHFVERDPALIKYYSSDTLPGSEILTGESADAFRFMRHTEEMYDVVILILPPPSTLLLNRFYTTDFFLEIKSHLRNNGIFMCSPGTGENYFNSESIVLYSSIFKSLSRVFKNVLPIVGNKLYYVASDYSLTSSICSLTEKRGIINTYVSSDFLSDDLIKMKSDNLLAMLNKNVSQNTLIKPVACFHFQAYTLARSREERIPAIVLIIIIFLLPLFTVKRKNLVMYSTAGALAGFEIIMLLLLQSSAGNMYRITGLIIAVMMTGLALGAGIGTNFTPKKPVLLASSVLIIFYICAGWAVNPIISAKSVFPVVAGISAFMLVPSFLTGFLFRTLTGNSDTGTSPSEIYSADLAGSAFGFITVTAVAVPLLGIRMTVFLLSALIFTGLVVGTIRNKY